MVDELRKCFEILLSIQRIDTKGIEIVFISENQFFITRSKQILKYYHTSLPFHDEKNIVQGVRFAQLLLWLGCVTEPNCQCLD